MLSHLTRLIGIINASNAALAHMTDPRLIAEVASMRETAQVLMSSLATDDTNRDTALELVFASPFNFAIACMVVDEYPDESVGRILELIVLLVPPPQQSIAAVA